MKNNNTKPANVQTENIAEVFRKSMDSISRFFDHIGIVKLLGECGAYKEKGVPVHVILRYIFKILSIVFWFFRSLSGAFFYHL